jgi:ribosomal-protein-alanine N-acetyltransferase
MSLETDRLILRKPRLSDAPDLLRFLGDADAMRYTRRLATLRECRRHIAGHDRQRRRIGVGPWAIVRKEDSRLIGLGGLYDDPFETGWGIEVGFHFVPSAWGHGYATELTRFCLQLGHDGLGYAEIRAFAHPDNIASRRVLEKSGFEKLNFVPAMNRHLYAHRRN